MNQVGPEECEFPNILLTAPTRPGERGRLEEGKRRNLIATIRSHQTVRYIIETKTIMGMILNDTPMPPEMSRNIRWPHNGTIYVEYLSPIKMDPLYPGDECPEYFNGLMIVPGESTAEIQTLGTSGIDLFTLKDTMDLNDGTITSERWKEIPEEVRETEKQGTRRYFARLAAYMNAFASREDRKTK